jgi:predicted metal-dependent peptidase
MSETQITKPEPKNYSEGVPSADRMKNLIAKFVLKYNYWGYLFSRIRRKPDPFLHSIMGVAPEKDGTVTLYYHPELFDHTEDKEILRIIEHEGMHLINKHIPRLLRILANETNMAMKHIKVQVFNISADCCVNTQANIRNPIIVAGDPWPPQLPEKYNLEEGKVTEYYYIELLKKAEDQTKCAKCGKPKPGFGKNDKQECSCDNGKSLQEMLEEMKNSSGGFDKHDKWLENVKSIADLSSLSRKVEQHVQNIIKESAKSFNKDRGSLPGHIADLIQQALAPPKAPYYQIIRKLVKGTRYSKYKRSPTKINRKRTYTFHINNDECVPAISPFPGKTRDMTFDICILIDTSGSMGPDDILEGLSGVKNIIENDRHCYTTVLEVDASVEKEYEVKRVRDIQFNIKGRGGTTLRPGLDRAKELNCDVCLAFTDGYTENINNIPRKFLPKKLIWVITKGGTAKNVNQTGWVVKI